ncbi:MAG: murein biosynthesis integral membrane protein MurJ [Planctomycetaceae bacterium]|nr:murein biosynthesis integral membrane protein MurJ [Planctomycetaceae bacterium]
MSPAPDSLVDRHGRLLRRTALVSVLTLMSRLLGFVREALAAVLFGAHSGVFDAFLTAWRIPNLFRRLLGEGALATSLQTAITEEDGKHGDAGGAALFRRVLWVTFWLLLVISVAAMAAIHHLPDQIGSFRPLGEPEGAQAVRELTVRLMPFVVFVCLAALVSGALNVRGFYASSSFAPAAMNVAWIGALVAIGYLYGWTSDAEGAALAEHQLEMARALSIGVLLAGLAQLLVQVPELRRSGLLSRAAAGLSGATRNARDVLTQAAPLALGAAVYQVNVMVDGFMAEGLLSDGGPTALYFANRIQQFPLALVATAATAAVFPALKALAHRGRVGELRELHDRTQLSVAFLALPAGAGLFALATPIASACLEYGAFDAAGSERVGSSMAILAFGLLPAGAVGLLSRVHYALGDFRRPVVVSIWMVLVNLALNLLFTAVLGWDVAGLSLGTTLAAWLQVALLLPNLHRRLDLPRAAPGAAREFLRTAAAATACGVAAYFAQRLAERWLPTSLHGGLRSAISLVPAVLAATAVYFALARALGLAAWQDVESRVRGRFARR